MNKHAKTLPKITIIIVTLNNQRTIENCLRNIISQNYPQNKIEYLNIDGGSIDDTRKILRKYGFKIINSPIKNNAEAQRAIGLLKAKNNLIISLDADNYLPSNNWFRQMIEPFLENPQLVHVNTLHYTYKRTDSLFNRYIALFGAVDPVVYYIGIPDRVSFIQKKWRGGKIIKETKSYYLVEFDKRNLPTVGCNGVVYRKDLLLKFAKSKPKEFLHIDVFIDLVEKGYNQFAIVKNSVIHDTAVTLPALLKKRIRFLDDYYLQNNKKRRYLIYNSKSLISNIKLLLFIIYTITFVKPFIDSLRGYLKIRDKAWFVHPFACWIYLYIYGRTTLTSFFRKK